MNSLLLILALALMGCVFFINKSEEPTIQAFSGYTTLISIVALVIAVLAIIGFCASCGGCFLFFYSILMNLLTIVCIVITIVGFVFYGLSTKNPDLSNKVFEIIDKYTEKYVEDEKNAEAWKTYQDLLNCCGYNGKGKTGSLCEVEEAKDCRVDMINVLSKYLLITCIVLCIITVVMFIISCSTKQYLHEGMCK